MTPEELRARVHPAPVVIDPGWDDNSEDWLRARSWDFWNEDGTPLTRLDALAATLGRPEEDVAADLLRLPFGKAAPPELLEEARRRATSAPS